MSLKLATILAPLGLLCSLVFGEAAPVLAGPGCAEPLIGQGGPCAVQALSPIEEFSAQTRRPRVTIYRRRVPLPPNAVRQCRSWLAREYRVSGPVIVPQMYCWWEY